MLSVHLSFLPVLNPYAGLNYVWQEWGKVGLAKISGSHKCPESRGWKESRRRVWSCLLSRDTHSTSQQHFSACPSASASHQPEDPAAPDALHPTGKQAKMLKTWGKERGIRRGQLWGVCKGNWVYCGRAHQEHRGREPGYCCGQLGQNIAVLSAIVHRTNCPYWMPLLPQETFLYEQQEWWERKIMEHPKSIADITCRKVILSTTLGVTSSNKADSDMAKT